MPSDDGNAKVGQPAQVQPRAKASTLNEKRQVEVFVFWQVKDFWCLKFGDLPLDFEALLN